MCGGKDRFRFDDKDGRGTWFCSHCGSAGGLKLLSLFIGKSVMDTAKELVGDDLTQRTIAPVRQKIDHEKIAKLNHERAARGAKSMLESAVMRSHPYMNKKGLDGEWPTNGDMMIDRFGDRIAAGELLLIPAYKNGQLVNMQKIKTDGEKRPITGGDMAGVYHLIEGKTKMIAIVEGFATGVTVNRMTGATTYCAFNTGNLVDVGKHARAQHPGSRIVFFADHDEIDSVHNWRPGTKYSEEAAIAVNGIVALSPELGDWDDYRQKHGAENCKQAMRDAIRKDSKVHNDKEVTQQTEKPAEPKHEPVTRLDEAPEDLPAPPARKPEPQASKPKLNKTGLPYGISLDEYDIDSPPGLAGEIVDYMKDGANRLLKGGAYPLMALQCMAMAGAGMQGLKGVKLSLITLTLGMSASGKEWPQRVIKELLDANGKTLYGDIRSDKDIIRSAIYDNGHCFYVIDEGQKILKTDGGSKHMSNVVNTLMELSTTSCYKLSQLHRDEFLAQMELAKSRFEKMVAAKEKDLEQFNPDLDEGKIKKTELDIANLKNKLDEFDQRMHTAQTGVKNPALNLLAYSTPQELAEIVNEKTIDNGFLGRALIADCGVERSESLVDLDFLSDSTGKQEGDDPQLVYLKSQIGLICQLAQDVVNGDVEQAFTGVKFRYLPTDEALEDLKAIARHYDQYQYRNHTRVGSIYARFLERIMALSSVMALGNIQKGVAVIERDFVRYALMLSLNSVEQLLSNLSINEGATDSSVEAKIEAVKEAIIKHLNIDRRDSMKGWRYESFIKKQIKRNKYYKDIQKECDKHDQDAFNNALAALYGRIERSECGKLIRLKK
jgi:putative DNA primase/helicase